MNIKLLMRQLKSDVRHALERKVTIKGKRNFVRLNVLKRNNKIRINGIDNQIVAWGG